MNPKPLFPPPRNRGRKMDDQLQEQGLLARAIARPVTVIALLLLVTFFGVFSVFDLPIQLTPDISAPTITVKTDWPGASPIEGEAEILVDQEEGLTRVAGLEAMESRARMGSGDVELEVPGG